MGQRKYKTSVTRVFYVCIVITFSRVRINRVWFSILLVVNGTRESDFFPRSRQRTWFREIGSAVPSRVSLLILHIQAGSGAYSRDSSRIPRRRSCISSTAIGSVPIRVDQVTHLRTDGVHRRESAGTGVVSPQGGSSNGGCLFRYHHGPISVRLPFPTLSIGTVDMCGT